MSEIEFSSLIGSPTPIDLNAFDQQYRHQIRYRPMGWANAWSDLLSFGLHNSGPDVSQVGSTWVGSLAGMQALRSFTDKEMSRIGSQDILPAVWKANQLPDDDAHYAIPWIADTRLIFYRKDLLEKAGIDEVGAFTSTESLVETVNRLTNAGVKIPLAFATQDEVLHYLASWVWGAGGDFRTSDQRHLNLTDPKTMMGIKQFYNLHRLLVSQAQSLRTDQVVNLFTTNQAAIILTVGSLALRLFYNTPQGMDLSVIGASPAPGIPFIGGSSLVLWKYSIYEDAGIAWIEYLLSPEAQNRLYQNNNELPVRLDLLEAEPFTTNPLLHAVARSLKLGRAFQTSYQWANIERRLHATFHQLWSDLFTNPQMDLDSEISRRVRETQNRIEKTILSA